MIIIGEGPDEQHLRDTARTTGLNVTFTGGIHGSDELARWYDRAAVTVVPGAAGLTVVQSLGFGVPVITHDTFEQQMPEVDAILPGETGLLFTQHDPSSLAAAIRSIIGASPSAKLKIAQSCQEEYRRNWTPRAHADRIADAIVEVSGRPSRRGRRTATSHRSSS